MERHRFPSASCDFGPAFQADPVRTQMLGWEVIHVSGTLPGENHPAERWLAHALNCLTLKSIVVIKPYRTVQTVENITLGEPDPALFDIPTSLVERRPSEMLTRAQEQRGGPAPKDHTREVLDKVYDRSRGREP